MNPVKATVVCNISKLSSTHRLNCLKGGRKYIYKTNFNNFQPSHWAVVLEVLSENALCINEYLQGMIKEYGKRFKLFKIHYSRNTMPLILLKIFPLFHTPSSQCPCHSLSSSESSFLSLRVLWWLPRCPASIQTFTPQGHSDFGEQRKVTRCQIQSIR